MTNDFESNPFVSSLKRVAKELETVARSRECIRQFETEVSSKEPPSSPTVRRMETDEEPNSADIGLNMDVQDDKDYDIEEIRFYNFISKNKGVKPSVIRTVVYKVPESAYVTRKSMVYVQEAVDSTQIEAKIAALVEEQKVKQDVSEKKVEKRPVRVEKGTQTTKVEPPPKEAPPPPIENTVKVEHNKKQPLSIGVGKNVTSGSLDNYSTPSQILHAQPKQPPKQPVNAASLGKAFADTGKYNMEDLIMIDEDDDILNYNEEDDEFDDLAVDKAPKVNEPEQQTKAAPPSEPAVETAACKVEPTPLPPPLPTSLPSVDEHSESGEVVVVDGSVEGGQVSCSERDFVLCVESESNDSSVAAAAAPAAKRRRGAPCKNKPKVVVEKAQEPVSTISVKAAAASNVTTRSRRSSVSNVAYATESSSSSSSVATTAPPSLTTSQPIAKIVGRRSSLKTTRRSSADVIEEPPKIELTSTKRMSHGNAKKRPASTSSSNTSIVSAPSSQVQPTGEQKTLRVTRSKAKLVN